MSRRFQLDDAPSPRRWRVDLSNVVWVPLGRGQFNDAFRSDRQALAAFDNGEKFLYFWVFKQTRNISNALDTPERSVRVWNLLNPDLPAMTYTTSDGRSGWVAPYIEGRQASDPEIASKLMDIFERTGRVVVDAVREMNFITIADGRTFCIDVGLALEPSIPSLKREASQTSLDFMSSAYASGSTMPWWHGLRDSATTETINALFYVKDLLHNRQNSPTLFKIKTEPAYRARLAKQYIDSTRDAALDEEIRIQEQSQTSTFSVIVTSTGSASAASALSYTLLDSHQMQQQQQIRTYRRVPPPTTAAAAASSSQDDSALLQQVIDQTEPLNKLTQWHTALFIYQKKYGDSETITSRFLQEANQISLNSNSPAVKLRALTAAFRSYLNRILSDSNYTPSNLLDVLIRNGAVVAQDYGIEIIAKNSLSGNSVSYKLRR